MDCRFATVTLLVMFVALAVPALSAPTLKEPLSNKVIRDDNHFSEDDQEEKAVARLILQLARDYDEGRLSLVDLVGRSAVEEDEEEPEVSSPVLARTVPQDLTKPTEEKVVFEKKPVRTT